MICYLKEILLVNEKIIYDKQIIDLYRKTFEEIAELISKRIESLSPKDAIAMLEALINNLMFNHISSLYHAGFEREFLFAFLDRFTTINKDFISNLKDIKHNLQ